MLQEFISIAQLFFSFGKLFHARWPSNANECALGQKCLAWIRELVGHMLNAVAEIFYLQIRMQLSVGHLLMFIYSWSL